MHGGSWVVRAVISGAINPLIWVDNYSYPTFNATLTAHEPPSKGAQEMPNKPTRRVNTVLTF